MTSRKMHMTVSLDYIERAIRADERENKPQTWLIDMVTKEPVSYTEALVSIERLRAEGLECLPSCDTTDATGHCAGHPVEENV